MQTKYNSILIKVFPSVSLAGFVIICDEIYLYTLDPRIPIFCNCYRKIYNKKIIIIIEKKLIYVTKSALYN